MSASAQRFSSLGLSTWAIVAAFGCYFCMYAFRKPFTAAEFKDDPFWGIDFKIILVTAQVLGYTVSKFIGIKLISELPPHRRLLFLVLFIGLAELALLLFAVTPRPWNFFWLFINGLPLGMVFGLVLSFLEGRRQTELLSAGLCASFISADGVVKSVGRYVLDWGVLEDFMPVVAGLLFLPPFLFFVWMLSKIPEPTPVDKDLRSERIPMHRDARSSLFRRYAPGLILIIAAYTLITIIRSIRADFAVEIWKSLGSRTPPDIFALSETLVGLAVFLTFSLFILVKNNRTAFFLSIAVSATGMALILLGTILLQAGYLDPFTFMVLNGLGLYLPYIAVHTTMFERLLAMTRERGTIGYLMYLADAIGYLGYIAIMFIKNFSQQRGFLNFFTTLTWGTGILGLLIFVPCWIYFARHPRTQVASNSPSLLHPQTAL